MDKEFLLKTYGAQYDSEAGPWNLSVENKYLEYMFAKFFEENFEIRSDMQVCNIGIGAGYWDRYLSYFLPEGELTSIDIDEVCCRQLRECLINEHNPNRINIIHSDVMKVEGKDETFDIVTMVGSARLESGLFREILEKAFRMLKKGGAMYYQSLDEQETKQEVLEVCRETVQEEAYLLDETYGFHAQYWKLVKR
ncbi:MAG: class I SAM-dependent methyltransferase [Lachnospiraceae bacterium]|nr:class I SAM-dependent methyltransferase [Lachnospiraceae bacterium]